MKEFNAEKIDKLISRKFGIDQDKLEVQSIEHYRDHVTARVFTEDGLMSFVFDYEGALISHGMVSEELDDKEKECIQDFAMLTIVPSIRAQIEEAEPGSKKEKEAFEFLIKELKELKNQL